MKKAKGRSKRIIQRFATHWRQDRNEKKTLHSSLRAYVEWVARHQILLKPSQHVIWKFHFWYLIRLWDCVILLLSSKTIGMTAIKISTEVHIDVLWASFRVQVVPLHHWYKLLHSKQLSRDYHIRKLRTFIIQERISVCARWFPPMNRLASDQLPQQINSLAKTIWGFKFLCRRTEP